METLYLSRRNLLSLLAKLDIVKEGGDSACTIIKYASEPKDEYRTTVTVQVVAVEDEDYYPAQSRLPGLMHPDTEKRLPK